MRGLLALATLIVLVQYAHSGSVYKKDYDSSYGARSYGREAYEKPYGKDDEHDHGYGYGDRYDIDAKKSYGYEDEDKKIDYDYKKPESYDKDAYGYKDVDEYKEKYTYKIKQDKKTVKIRKNQFFFQK